MIHRGRRALVTGGTAGIGLAIGRHLAREGAAVTLAGRRDPDGLDLPVLRLDVTAPDLPDPGPVDILVNAAGVSTHQPVAGHDPGDWQRVIDTNLTGAFRMTRAVLPGMQARGWGRIVNIGSTAARVGAAGHAAYCASKAGLVALGRVVALEGAAHGVTCTTVSPTWVETDMLHAAANAQAARTGTAPGDEVARLARANPQGLLVQPDEVAGLVSWLCSDAARAVTMEDIQINAGALW